VEGSPPAPPGWLTFADRGEYDRALHALEEQGGFDAVLYGSSADELMILVDIARATGNRGRAVQALRRVTQQFPGDPNAPIATMMLGKMLMQAGDQRGAAEAFSLYRRLSPQGDFAEDALANHFEAALEQGDMERARMLAKQYESDFPDGRSLEEIRQQLQTAEQALAAEAAEEALEAESDGEDEEGPVVESPDPDAP
jgi:outer membrane protein assembly factor BamD (BamD/ComL family)